MTIVSGIFLLSASFCALMLFVLRSVACSREAGVREWALANQAAFISFLAYALGRQLPPLLAYEFANASYALASLAVLAGFRRFAGKNISMSWLALALTAFIAAIAYFHYVHDSFALRTVTVSMFQCIVLSLIAVTVLSMHEQSGTRRPFLFTAGVAVVIAAGNAVRAAVHFMQADQVTSLLQPSATGILFLSAGALVLPALTFGAVMMVHERVLARTGGAIDSDFLTGAWTKNAFLALLDHELARAERSGKYPSLLVFHVEHTLAQQEGDEEGKDKMLVDFALRASEAIRAGDMLGRLGAGSFAVLLPETGKASALAVADRVRSRFANSYASTASCKAGEPVIGIGFASARTADRANDVIARAESATEHAFTLS